MGLGDSLQWLVQWSSRTASQWVQRAVRFDGDTVQLGKVEDRLLLVINVWLEIDLIVQRSVTCRGYPLSLKSLPDLQRALFWLTEGGVRAARR